MKRCALVLFLAALYLPALGSSSSGTHPDESYYLGISAEMDVRGAWLTPTLDGDPKWFKPPLLYWAERVAYAAFGRGFFGGRLPVALAAVALAILTGALARRMYGAEAEVPAALLTGTLFGWLKFGRIAMMDAPMALALTAAAYGAWRASEEEGGAPQLLWVGVGAGAAFMLKGPVGVVLVVLIAGGFLAIRRPRLLLSRFAAGAFALGAAIGLPWYAASFLEHGRRFYDFFVIDQNVDRFRHPWTVAGELVLVVGWLVYLLPWTVVALAALPRPGRWRDPRMALPLVWMGAVLLVFTLPSLKWPHYGLACAPAAVLLMSARPVPARWARVTTAILLAACALVFVAVLRWRLPAIATASLLAAAAALAASAGAVLSRRLAMSAALAGCGFALVLAFVIPTANPEVIPARERAALADRDLYVYDFAPGIFTMGVGRPVHRVERDDIEATLDRGGVIIFTAHALSTVPLALRDRLASVARWEHVMTEVPPARVLQAWKSGDTRPLLEPMLAVELAGHLR